MSETGLNDAVNNGRIKLLLAKNAGFCFGVRRAVELARKTVQKCREQNPNGVIYTYGELIHNKTVVENLRREGIIPIETLESVKAGDLVVIRSHGVPESVVTFLKERNVNIIDATCPFVSSIHKIVNKAYANGEQVFIVGDRNHPEAIGINGH